MNFVKKAKRRERQKTLVSETPQSIENLLKDHESEMTDIQKLYAAVCYYREEKVNTTFKFKELLTYVDEKISSNEDIMQDVYPLLKEEYRFIKLMAIDICTTPKGMTVLNNKGVDCFEYTHASEYPVTVDHLNLLKQINAFNAGMTDAYLTTKVKFLDSVWSDECCSDLLGLYKRIKNEKGEVVPQVWLFLNRIYEANEQYCDKHQITGEGRKNTLKYIIAYVYIHEMMHRYFDIRPDLNLKRSVPCIEEPMAEFAALKFCEAFGDDMLLWIAKYMVKEKKNGCYDYYSIGYDLFMDKDKVPEDLIDIYRRVSMIIHKNNDPVIKMGKVDVDSIVKVINEYETALQI